MCLVAQDPKLYAAALRFAKGWNSRCQTVPGHRNRIVFCWVGEKGDVLCAVAQCAHCRACKDPRGAFIELHGAAVLPSGELQVDLRPFDEHCAIHSERVVSIL